MALSKKWKKKKKEWFYFFKCCHTTTLHQFCLWVQHNLKRKWRPNLKAKDTAPCNKKKNTACCDLIQKSNTERIKHENGVVQPRWWCLAKHTTNNTQLTTTCFKTHFWDENISTEKTWLNTDFKPENEFIPFLLVYFSGTLSSKALLLVWKLKARKQWD